MIRIAPEQPAAFASFGFDDADQLLQCLIACVGDGMVARAFAMDRVKSQDAGKVEFGDALRTSAAVIQQSGSLVQSAKDAAKLVRLAVAPHDESHGRCMRRCEFAHAGRRGRSIAARPRDLRVARDGGR